MPKVHSIEIIPVRGIAEVKKGDNIGEIILEAAKKQGTRIQENDVIVVTNKIVSKAEGRVIELRSVIPSSFAAKAGRQIGKDPRQVEVILSESRRLVKMVKGLIIAETRHGFVCANAGTDMSNITKGSIVLLPKRPDESAQRIRNTFTNKTRKSVAVVISDTFGRPWREGQVDVAIGLAGIEPFADYRGVRDQYGYELKASIICIADEIASAAELTMNKLDRNPVAIIRGYRYKRNLNASSKSIRRKPARDLFR